MQRYYPHIAVAAGVLVLLLILWGPSGGDGARDSIVWEEDWQVIEYYSDSESSHPTLRLFREPGLVSDDYFVETLANANQDGEEQAPEAKPEYIRRRGGPSVTNTFRDWRRPKLNAYHELSPEREEEFGLKSPEHFLRFYESPGGTPVELRAGVKSGGANRFVASNYYDHEDLLLIVGSYLFDKFTQPPFTYREKRILYYPTGSYTREIRVTNEAGETLRLNAGQVEREQGGPLTVYRRHNAADDSSTEIPRNIASPLDAAVKSMLIHRFRDEAAAIGDAEALWEQAGKNFAEVNVKIEKGDTYWIRFRQAPGLEAVDEDLILIQSSVSMGTDWARRTAVENALRNMQIIAGYVPPEPQPEVQQSLENEADENGQ